MIKTLITSAALVVGVSTIASAQSMMSGDGMMMPRHHRTMMRKKHHVSYGVGSGGQSRTTATGGNAGGYSSRN